MKKTYLIGVLLIFASGQPVFAEQLAVVPFEPMGNRSINIPHKLYVEFKKEQPINKNGIELDLVYINKSKKNLDLVLDDNYCAVFISDGSGRSVSPKYQRHPDGIDTLLSKELNKKDAVPVQKGGKIKKKIIIDKMVSINKDKQSNSDENIIDIQPSMYGISLQCMIGIYISTNNKIELLGLPAQTMIFNVIYGGRN